MADFPDDTVQNLVGAPWWQRTAKQPPRRGQLVWAWALHHATRPFSLNPDGKREPADHKKFALRIEAVPGGMPLARPEPPVAALPLDEGEAFLVHRAKRRLALVLGVGGPDVPERQAAGTLGLHTAAAMLVAPYYSAEASDKRGGFAPELLARIRRAEYPQYLWDSLPLPGAASVVLRLDQAQPIGRHAEACEPTEWALSDPALAVVDEWWDWCMRGTLRPDAALLDLRALLREFEHRG